MTEPLRILHLATSDLEGGAARAAFRTHVALRRAGADSHLLVRTRRSDDDAVTTVDPLPPWESRRRRLAARLPRGRPRLPEALATFNFDLRQDFDERSLFRFEGIDIVCFHRITRFLTVAQMRAIHDHYRCPVVWILNDQHPVTGGCHYSLDCDGYTRSCGRCPQLASDDPDDPSHIMWERKHRLLQPLPLVFLAASSDTEQWVRQSSLFSEHRVERIPYPVDGEVFRSADRQAARAVLGVPSDAKIILLAAAYLPALRKGAALGVEALRRLEELAEPALREKLFLLTLGDGCEDVLEASTLRGRALGRFNDDLAIAVACQAADLFLSPSSADSGPMMVTESLLCGRPVVAFARGYALDLADGATVRVTDVGDVEGLAQALHDTLAHAVDPDACRRAAHAFEMPQVAAAYLSLCRSLTGA